jgi:hypothetical protein
MMRASTIVALAASSLALFSTAAHADDTASPTPPGKTVTVELKIKGRHVAPQASFDVSRLVQRTPLPELRKPLLDRIGAAAEKDPF